MSKYFQNIVESVKSVSGGLKLTLGYLFDATKSRKPMGIEADDYFDLDKGIITLQYPHESFPVPDNGRYRLHNEIDDCIVCDKCAKVCPVDCIEIEPIKATETIGYTSDGTAKRIHAAKFDIDMGKCCFCGLCTTVCPTECLTMTKVYDFSEFDVRDHKYSFSEMSLVEIAQKRQEAEEADRQKAEAKASVQESKPEATVQTEVTAKPKPAFRPKPMVSKAKADGAEESADSKPKPKFRPKPMIKKKDDSENIEAKSTETEESKPKARPVFKPKPMVKKQESGEAEEKKEAKPKPVMKPRPVVQKKDEDIKADGKPEGEESKEKPKFRPRPMIKRKPKDNGDAS